MVGVDSDSLTLRELLWRADGKRRDEWSRTALLCALVHNQWCKKEHARSASHFNPYERDAAAGPQRRIRQGNIHELKALVPHGESEAD